MKALILLLVRCMCCNERWGRLHRQEAVDVVKEIEASCKFLNPREIFLEQSDKADHYEIHVKDHIDDEIWECLKGIAKKSDLEMKLTDHMLVIYKP